MAHCPKLAVPPGCAFIEGRLRDLRVLVILYDLSVHWCGAIIRVLADSQGYAVAGGFQESHNLLGAEFLLPLDRVSSPAHRCTAKAWFACWPRGPRHSPSP